MKSIFPKITKQGFAHGSMLGLIVAMVSIVGTELADGRTFERTRETLSKELCSGYPEGFCIVEWCGRTQEGREVCSIRINNYQSTYDCNPRQKSCEGTSTRPNAGSSRRLSSAS